MQDFAKEKWNISIPIKFKISMALNLIKCIHLIFINKFIHPITLFNQRKYLYSIKRIQKFI